MAKNQRKEATRFFTGLFGLIAVLVAAVNIVFTSCTPQYEGEGEWSTDTVEVAKPVVVRDTINDTIVHDLGWLSEMKVDNRFDTIYIDLHVENAKEAHLIPSKISFGPLQDNYEIPEDKELLTPKYANEHVIRTVPVREEETDSGWVDVTKIYFTPEDGNPLVVEARMGHLKNLPYVRFNTSEIISLIDPSLSTRATYKKKDSPIEATSKAHFEAVGFANDTTFTEDQKCDYNRFVMAEDEIDHKLIVAQGTDTIDAQTLKDSLKIQNIMKSKEQHETVEYFIRHLEYTTRTFTSDDVNDFSGYRFSNVIGISNYEAEKVMPTTGNFTPYQKIDVYRGAIAGEKPFNTEYYIKTQRVDYNDPKWDIKASFGYPKIKVAEDGTTLNVVTSDRSGYDKAIVTNKVDVKCGRFTTPLSETKALYKEAKVERKVVDKGWDYSKTKEEWTPTTHLCQGTYFWLWNDGTREEKVYEWVVSRILTPGEIFERVCKDNTNRTGRPSIIDLKSTPKSKKDQDATWSGSEDKATIGTSVEFNGADKADVLFYSTEINDIKCQIGDDVLDFGHNTYDFTLTPTLGSSTVKGDYSVFPYSAVLSYKFGSSDAKKVTDTGNILVKESRFFDFATVQYAVATTAMTQDWLDWLYCISIHLYNEETGKYYVLPVMIEQNAPHTMKWDFSLLEECEKEFYNKYNSIACQNHKKWRNAYAEDTKIWMQWSSADEGTKKEGFNTMMYSTAKSINWDLPSFKDNRATVHTKRYKCEVKDGRLFITDTYDNVKLTDKHCVNGGWK